MRKRRFWVWILVLCLAAAVLPSALGETLEEGAELLKSAQSVDEQLAIISRLADEHARQLESIWSGELRVTCAGDLPAGLIPMNFDTHGFAKADGFPEEARGHKFIALYIARDGERPELAGDWLARFPKDMRAASLEEAEYALVIEGWWTPSGYKYIPFGSSSHRDYAAYVLNLKTGKAVRFWSHRNGAKTSGKVGQLSGDNMSSSAMWTAMRTFIWGTIRYDLGNGAALLFTPTGASCFLNGYEGDPVDVEIPAEVEGHPVASLAAGVFSNCSSLKSIVLPEGLAEISSGAFRDCRHLETVVLPSSLSAIRSNAFTDCDAVRTLSLPAGLESLGKNAFYSLDSLVEVTLPAGLSHVESGIFSMCGNLARVVLEEGVTSFPEDAFSDCTHLACIYLPASLKVSSRLSAIDPHAMVYAPEGSEALEWARNNGYETAVCASPTDMPAVEYVTEGDLVFRLFLGEAALADYLGDGPEVTVPETAGGMPVAGVLYRAVYQAENVETVVLPESVRYIHSYALRAGSGVRHFHVYIPNPDCRIEPDALRPAKSSSGYALTVHGPDGSAVRRYVTDTADPEHILFEPMGESADANVRSLQDALSLAKQVRENTAAFWDSCDREEYSLLASVPGYEIGRPQAVAVLRITGAELTDPSLLMAGNENALKMYATLANTRANPAYARAASQTAAAAQLTPVADGTSAIVILAYPDDWILVSLLQNGRAQASLLSAAAGIPAELTEAYVTETAAAYGVTGECRLYTTAEFEAITGK